MRKAIIPLISLVVVFGCDPIGHDHDGPVPVFTVECDTLAQYSASGPSFKLSCTSGARNMKMIYMVDGDAKDTLIFNAPCVLEVFPAAAFKDRQEEVLVSHATRMDTLKVEGKLINPATRDTVLFKAYTRIIPQISASVSVTDYSSSIMAVTEITTFPKPSYKSVSSSYVNIDTDESYKTSPLSTQTGFRTVGVMLSHPGVYDFIFNIDDLTFRFEKHCINYADITVKCGIEEFEGKVRPILKYGYKDNRTVDKRMGIVLTVTAKGECTWMEDFHQTIEECESYQHNYVYNDKLDYQKPVNQEDMIVNAEYPLSLDFRESILLHRVDVRAAKNPDGTVYKQKDPVLGYYIVFETYDKYYDMETVELSVLLDSGGLEYVRITDFDINDIRQYLSQLYAKEKEKQNTYAETISDISRKLTAIIQQAE